MESDATGTRADEAYRATGMWEVCERYGVPFINLSKLGGQVEVEVRDGRTLRRVKVAKLVAEGFVVSAAKMKTHFDIVVTLSLKNMLEGTA